MSLLIAFVTLSISLSFLCSILEAALLSLTPSFIARQALERPNLHKRLKELKEHIDQPLAAILTLNTIAHTVGAVGVGAQVTIVFGDGYLTLASVVMTVLILVLSEILPKTFGARYWPQLAPLLPPVLGFMIMALKPAIWFSERLMRFFGAREPELDLRQEIKAMTVLGREMGKLDEDEQRVISNILDLHETRVRDIMTPRTVCEVARPDETVAELAERVRREQFSRYPVLGPDEEPLGIVFRYDMLEQSSEKTVCKLMKPANVVPDTMNAENLLSMLMRERQHMSLVYDEYGTWLGIVTMEDVLEAIIGRPIMDETDDIPNMRRFAKRRWEHKRKFM
jgi:CBS domain containing-hemolysin-like protein